MTVLQSSQFASRWTLNSGGVLSTIDTPWVMGILNVTPDSFHDGGEYSTVDKALAQSKKMLDAGAKIIDVGGNSSRPGAKPVDEKTEMDRVIPVIQAIKASLPNTIISIDSFRSKVVEAAVSAGASIINDISAGGLDGKMFETVARLKVPYVLMHMQGDPSNMQNAPDYANVVGEVAHFFSGKLAKLRALGVNDIILDPGFGFGKTIEHNYQLLGTLNDLKIFGLPIMVGVSRKSMINKVLKVGSEFALNGTTVINTMALQKGAAIIRVHDVLEAMESRELVSQANNSEYEP